MADRMFHVLVLGGFALAGCGGTAAGNVMPPANGDGDGAMADGAFGAGDANAHGDATGNSTDDGAVGTDAPGPLPEASAMYGSMDGVADAFADTSNDATIGPCRSVLCCSGENCCHPIVCEGPQ